MYITHKVQETNTKTGQEPSKPKNLSTSRYKTLLEHAFTTQGTRIPTAGENKQNKTNKKTNIGSQYKI